MIFLKRIKLPKCQKLMQLEPAFFMKKYVDLKKYKKFRFLQSNVIIEIIYFWFVL